MVEMKMAFGPSIARNCVTRGSCASLIFLVLFWWLFFRFVFIFVYTKDQYKSNEIQSRVSDTVRWSNIVLKTEQDNADVALANIENDLDSIKLTTSMQSSFERCAVGHAHTCTNASFHFTFFSFTSTIRFQFYDHSCASAWNMVSRTFYLSIGSHVGLASTVVLWEITSTVIFIRTDSSFIDGDKRLSRLDLPVQFDVSVRQFSDFALDSRNRTSRFWNETRKKQNRLY